MNGRRDKMELTQKEIRIQLLNSIMQENLISLKSVDSCMEQRENEINNMDTIFDHDAPESIRKRLVLLKLISRNRADENLKYYIEAKGIIKASIETDMEAYKVLIVTALMFNIKFFVRARTWLGLLQREVKLIKERTSAGTTVEQGANKSYVFRIPSGKRINTEQKVAISEEGEGLFYVIEDSAVTVIDGTSGLNWEMEAYMAQDGNNKLKFKIVCMDSISTDDSPALPDSFDITFYGNGKKKEQAHFTRDHTEEKFAFISDIIDNFNYEYITFENGGLL
jgi:hypothetical protein